MKYYYVKSLEKILETIKERKIIFYKMDILTEIIYKNLIQMGKDIEYFVSDNLLEKYWENKEIKNIYDLLYEDKNDIYILVFAVNGHAQAYEKLTNMGFEFEKEFGVYGMAGYSGKFDAIDSLLGFNRKYEDLWGFKVYSNSKSPDIKIMTLGGSTSDPTLGNYKSWPELLYEKIAENYNVVVYSGGITGYSVNQEFLKFVRDGLTLRPNILLTFDGYNDVGFNVEVKEHPYLHRYQYKFYDYIQQRKPIGPSTLDMRNPNLIVHGLDYQIDDSENWISTIRKIHTIAEEFGILHFSFFQPMILSGKALVDDSITALRNELFKQDLHYKKTYSEIPEYVCRCQQAMEKYPYITDLTNIFDGEDDVYYDMCHSSEKGNYIIMNYIYDRIEDALEELAK